MPYVILRTDQGGGWLTMPGSEHSYSRDIRQARKFTTRADAEKESNGGNERVQTLEEACSP